MTYRVVFTDPHQHEFDDRTLDLLTGVDAKLESRFCANEEETIAFCRDADAVMTSACKISATVIEGMRQCRVIARLGIGYDNIDHRAAAEKGIPVTNVPDFCTEEVANHTIALLLACHRKVAVLDGEVRQGLWQQDHALPSRRLSTQTLGLLGFGAIGRAVAIRAAAIGLRIGYFDPYADTPNSQSYYERFETMESLLRQSDYVSLHLPLNTETCHLMGRLAFAAMKPTAILINTSRGGVVQETALIEALETGKISGAGLDVLEQEPPSPDNPLLQMPNVVLSPHCAAHTSDSLSELRRRAVEEVVRALRGEPLKHIVNGVSFPN